MNYTTQIKQHTELALISYRSNYHIKVSVFIEAMPLNFSLISGSHLII